MQIALAAVVVLTVAGCGGDDTATKTVTAPGKTVTVTQGAATTPTQSPDTSGADSASDAPGPPLPAGVVGVDGRYLLKTVSTDYDNQNIGVKRFGAYEEPSTATTKCAGERCSVTFRFGLKSGGTKAYTLRADPARDLTYVGTGRGQIECLDNDRTKAQSRERIAVRAGSPAKIGGREVAGRISLYATITARCPTTTGSEHQAVRFVATLRGPRQ
jgi:hypothetical protein